MRKIIGAIFAALLLTVGVAAKPAVKGVPTNYRIGPVPFLAQGINTGIARRLIALSTPATCSESLKGFAYYDTDDNKPYFCNGTDWTSMDASTATVAWSGLSAPTGAINMTSDGTSEVITLTYTANYASGCIFCIVQSTGNPSGGSALGITIADADMSTALFVNNGSANTATISRTGIITGTQFVSSSSTAGTIALEETDANGSHAVTIAAPDSVTASYTWTLPAADGSGLIKVASGTISTTAFIDKKWLPAAACQNTTATLIWDTPTSNPAVAACITGSNTQKGVADFADSADLSMQQTLLLPSDWTSTGGVDVAIKWLTTATSGNVVWQVSTICVADAETDDPAFNTASTVTDAAKGTTNQTNDAAITGLTVTGCAAGELLHLKVQRDAAHASDTLAATARLIGIELTLRRVI